MNVLFKTVACIQHYQNKAMCTHNSTDALQDLFALLLDCRRECQCPLRKRSQAASTMIRIRPCARNAQSSECITHSIYDCSVQPFWRTGGGHGIKQRERSAAQKVTRNKSVRMLVLLYTSLVSLSPKRLSAKYLTYHNSNVSRDSILCSVEA